MMKFKMILEVAEYNAAIEAILGHVYDGVEMPAPYIIGSISELGAKKWAVFGMTRPTGISRTESVKYRKELLPIVRLLH